MFPEKSGGPPVFGAQAWKRYFRPIAPLNIWGYWFAFTAQAVRYLRHYGFNALGEYTSNYAMPFDTNNRGRGNSEKMPFIGIANTALFATVTTDANGAHVRVWFEDAGNGSAIGGMYSSAAPWLGSLANTRFFLSFIIPADLTIDLTRPNITIKMLVLETGTTIAYTIWVHRMV